MSGHWRMGRRPQGTSSPEKDFGILKANGLSGNWGKSGGSSGVQAEGRRVGWKIGSQGVPKILVVGASLYPRGRQVPRVREGLIGQAVPIVDVCGICVHQHPSHLVLGSVHSLQERKEEGEEDIFRGGRERRTPYFACTFPRCGRVESRLPRAGDGERTST